jgi:hypothetical protein
MQPGSVQAPLDEASVRDMLGRIERLRRQLYAACDSLLEAIAPPTPGAPLRSPVPALLRPRAERSASFLAG